MCCEMLLRHNWVGEARVFRSGGSLLDVFSMIQCHFFHSDPRRCLTLLFLPTRFTFFPRTLRSLGVWRSVAKEDGEQCWTLV